MEILKVQYNGELAGALSYDTERKVGFFEYDPKFTKKGRELSPVMMPLSDKIYSFPNLNYATFKGLPGMLADSLPDDFGNAVLNAWVAAQGRNRSNTPITPIERLQYTGIRGMGALTYHPATQVKNLSASNNIEIKNLVDIAQEIVSGREDFSVELRQDNKADQESMLALLSVGMSAGGARPKAVLAFNEDFKQVRSGQAKIPTGFTHYLMKFDGVSEHNESKETFGDPMGYGAMEFTYYQLAKECDIDMNPSRLVDEGPRRHFITKRFDRDWNRRIHVQTLNALAHRSFQEPGSYSYAEIFSLGRQLNLPKNDAVELFKRMLFNVVARNHDDHSKNFAFTMDEYGTWRLSPAYDIAYSYKPDSKWVNQHWMSINNKRDNFSRLDFYSFEKVSPIFTRKFIDETIDKTIAVMSRWRDTATNNDVPASLVKEVQKNLRLSL